MANEFKAIRVTRINGLQTILNAPAEKILMTQVLNKTDKEIVKVERGVASYGKDDSGEITKVFTSSATIFQSRENETAELANKSLAAAVEAHEMLQAERMEKKSLEEEIAALKAQLKAVEQKTSGAKDAKAEKAVKP